MKRGTLILGGIALLVIAVLTVLWLSAAAGRRSAGLRADSLEAVADTQKTIAGSQVLRIVQLQGELAQSKADLALKAKPKVVVRTIVRVDTVTGEAVGSPVTTDSNDVRMGSAHIRHEPFTVDLDIAMPPAPVPVRIPRYRIGLDPFSLEPRISCSIERVNGIRKAFVAFDSLPRWATIEILGAQASADVCNAASEFGVSLKVPAWTLPAAGGLGFLLGILITR